MQAVPFANRQWTLDDFSYSGYFLGGRPLGSVPCNVQAVTAIADISAALQAAINAAGQSGGGIIRIPAGSFTMSAPVQIPYSNISIEGAGSGQTNIDVLASYASPDAPNDGLFTFGKTFGHSNQGWVGQGPIAASVATVIHRGDLQVDTVNASSVQVGNWIVVQQYFWPVFVQANSQNPDAWAPNSPEFSFSYLRQVTGVTNNRVFLDAPVPWTLDPANNLIYLRFTDNQMRENVGLKGVSIHFENNSGADGKPHGTGVLFEGVRNGWIDDVHISNFPRNGVDLRYSARITVLDSAVTGAQDTSSPAYGFGFLTEASQNVLIKRSRSEQTRANFASAGGLTSVLVETQDVSRNATEADGPYSAFEQGLLWDEFSQQDGEALVAVNRGDQSAGEYQTLGSGVVWNFSGDGQAANEQGSNVFWGGDVHVAPSPDGHAILVGGAGADSVFDHSDESANPAQQGDPVPPAAGLQVGSGAAAPKNVLYEGLGQTGLQPASLFEAQLANRLGPVPADWVNACVPVPKMTAAGVGNGFSNISGAVSPGEIVAIYGTNLGPAALTGLQLNTAGLVSTNLAGTRVFFDATPAPVIYTSAGQVAVVVPYEIGGAPTTMLRMEYQGQRSPAIPLASNLVSPALLSADGTGRGQVLALNADGSGYNWAQNPVSRGAYLTMYATGFGPTDPAGIDGASGAAPFSKPRLPVEVRVGGLLANIQYAGQAPNFVSGFDQINIQIPRNAQTGPSVPIEVYVDGIGSPAGVTISVR